MNAADPQSARSGPLESRELVVHSGKGNNTRTVFLSDKVVRVIRDYVKHERVQYNLAHIPPCF